ncbi:pyrimidine-nucleoside phosphorylase [Abiotrophia sp.]|jgi:pyrimidine-nucleoside phosphorylase|uniref:pyrimidine-nucleoside phosphorylase n=1 Tax=Abiotrophia sp. TaxID=76631 RepID=UPI001CADE162|nr:pyrimidine-nucleoside phosphorylase [Abiotrophia sp.]MBF0936663.1 pyrimidine-nucleoside phosphorylase [Abiotrophia sp.]MBF0942663.1 pyrimidine-nucleoside phosphorylase [Abiotrophia sp.]
MRVVDLIEKKQAGLALSQEEINFLIAGYTDGTIPDYQMSALAMAIYFQGMTEEEASYLTMAMVKSGDEIDLSAIHGVKVDKHSTGGVGDTTTLVLAPLVAACGVPVAKMSGRGLGHTGGTTDKLEAIPGFSVTLLPQDFIDHVNRYKIAVVGQSGNLTPADKKLYALRDVTGTVQSIPLIASSIMSKKIAAGADAIVLDVKTGEGAFMKTLADAEALAHTMVKIGHQVGRKTLAVISDMSQPLGYMIGNALEVKEAIQTLQGQGPEDLTELCLVLGGQMLLAANRVASLEEGKALLQEQIDSGRALEVFKTFLANQGGDTRIVDNPDLLPQARYQIPLLAQSSGVVSQWVADEVGVAAMMLGAGRETKEDIIDPAVGIELCAKVGDPIQEGQPLAILHSNREDVSEVLARLSAAISIADSAQVPELIRKVIVE